MIKPGPLILGDFRGRILQVGSFLCRHQTISKFLRQYLAVYMTFFPGFCFFSEKVRVQLQH